MEIKELREEIDHLDRELLKLFLKRMQVSEAVAEYKMEHNLEILNAKREQEVLDKVSEQAGDMGAYARELFEKIMELSRHRQQEMMKK
ncbi:MAG: chorismate mutase [Lachnospiraceae bacterium]